MKNPGIQKLVSELEALPSYQGWQFTYEYPGLFSYSHPESSYIVFFTPDWEDDATLPIEVQDQEGQSYDAYAALLDFPHKGRSGAKIFSMVLPTLKKLSALLKKTRARPALQQPVVKKTSAQLNREIQKELSKAGLHRKRV